MSLTSNSVRLHNPFLPRSYDLHLKVDLANWKYDAYETIVLQRVDEVDLSKFVRLHYSPSMNIKEVTGATIVERDEKAGTLQLELPGELTERHIVSFAFSHEIREEMRGFYRAKFKTDDAVEHRMAATHFEPTAARLLYICQDEPSARADFTLHVSLPLNMEGFTVLSNGPLEAKEQRDDVVIHHFKTISAIPPYLTSCFIGELEYVGSSVRGIPVKVYTTIGKLERANFALNTVVHALEHFESFFNCKYPLPKLDVVAVPDFPIGGMENWGCIACVEAILVDEKTSSVAALKGAAELLSHEVSHNWFGNLVTINWWEGLWLKEGFASWCGYDAAHKLQPLWKCDEDAAMEVRRALVSDMYEHSHPVEVPINDPAEITEIFDDISYGKGMGLVFMLQAFLREKWTSSLAHYIKKYQFRDTRTIQLWEALEEASGVPLIEEMQSFVTQMGYPMIHVGRPSFDVIVLRQEPCQFVTALTKKKTLWSIPIVLEGKDGATHCISFRGSEPQQIGLPERLAVSSWITANSNGKGFFRCRYDDTAFSQMVSQYACLSVSDRCSLISDTMASIYMGYEDFNRLAIFPSLLFEHETNKNVWQTFYDCMEYIISIMKEQSLQSELRSNIMHGIGLKATKIIKTKPKTIEERLNRAFFINATTSTALKLKGSEKAWASEILQCAQQEAQAYITGGEFCVDTLATSLSAYVRESKEVAYERTEILWEKYCATNNNDEICRCILRALCWAEDIKYVESVAKKCIYNEGIRSQYGGVVFAAMASNPSCPQGYVWSFFKEHFKGIEQQWGSGTFRIASIVESVASSLFGETLAKEFDEFFQVNPLPYAQSAICRAVEDIRLRTWLQEKWGVGLRLNNCFFPR